jgi:uncharacterized membrane protein YhiD involved in acid resistance
MRKEELARWAVWIVVLILLVILFSHPQWAAFERKIDQVVEQLEGIGEGGPHLPPTINRPTSILATLIIAGILGGLLSFRRRATSLQISVLQAHMGLSIASAMMMIIIGNSLARAFGLMGAASIVRYRYNLADPKEGSSLIAALGVGIACGVGLYSLAVLGTIVAIIALNIARLAPESAFHFLLRPTRTWQLTITTTDPEGTMERMVKLFNLKGIRHTMTSYSRDEDEAEIVFRIQADARIDRDSLTKEMMIEPVTEISWKERDQ